MKSATALFATVLLSCSAMPAFAHDPAAHGASAAHSHDHAAFQSGRLHVRLDGEEGLPDLILIPGLSSSPAIWQETVDRLKGQYRIHRIHVHGFAGAAAGENAQNGETPLPVAAPVAEEIARYIQESGLNRPAVVGHSMGGTIGLMLSARHPELVSKLMVVDMMPFIGAVFGPPGTTAASITPVADQIWAAQAKVPHEQYVTAATETITGMIDTADRREEALEHMRQSDQGVSAAAFRELIVTDLRPELSNITAPTTVLYVKFKNDAMTDQIVDIIYRASYANNPAIALKRIDDSAHFIMFDQPQVFATEIDTFLKSN